MTSSATPGEAALPREPSFGPAFDAAPTHPIPLTPSAQATTHGLPIRFTGSGSEYFRIWIVNLLLTLVTLGIYYPWAKVRRLRYFYGNTLVGEHPLDFHGDPKKMLRGYLLVGAMVVLYSVAGSFSALAGLIAFVIVVALWPALLKSSMQFRMANTSWRGLRFHFKGTLGGAYAALVPLFVPGLVIVAAVFAAPNEQKPPDWLVVLIMSVLLITVLAMPWLLWKLKKYQHDNYALAQWQTELRATTGSFYVVFLKTIGVTLLAAIVLFAVFSSAAAMLGSVVSLAGNEGGGTGIIVAGIVAIVAVVIGMLVVQMLPRPYLMSRMQNLLWGRTGNRSMRFRSDLKFTPLLGLTLKNWLLMVVTLGLYWPFAAVALARMQLEAVAVETRVDPDTLFDQARPAEGDAAGDAAGDLLDFDIGL